MHITIARLGARFTNNQRLEMKPLDDNGEMTMTCRVMRICLIGFLILAALPLPCIARGAAAKAGPGPVELPWEQLVVRLG